MVVEDTSRRDPLPNGQLAEVPAEPGGGTLLAGRPDGGDDSSLFRRDDPHGGQGGRRFDRRWWDYSAREWVDWPEAVRRGADPSRRLYTQQQLDQAVAAARAAAVVTPVGAHLMEPGGWCRTCGNHHSHVEWARIHDQLSSEGGGL